MQDNKNPSLDSYRQSLKNINGIFFTPREIDILACLTNGRGAKTISAFLSISSKTVEAHTHNIMQKIGHHSREGIITFIEKSEKFETIKKYYSYLLMQVAFEEKLQKISILAKSIPTVCYIIYKEDQESFFYQLKKDLNQVGVKVVPKIKTDSPSMAKFISAPKKNGKHCFLYCNLDTTSLLKKENNENTLECSSLIKKSMQQPGSVIFLLFDDKKIVEISTIIPGAICINYQEEKNYYFSFFCILKNLFPDNFIAQIINEFTDQHSLNENSFQVTSSLLSLKKGDVGVSLTLNKKSIIFLKNSSIKYIFLLTMILCMTSLVIFLSTVKYKNTFNVNKNEKTRASNLVHSDLIIPNEHNLLPRPLLLSQIEKKLKQPQEIQTLALVGVGGAGKTTLARQYAHRQNLPIIWEINAETHETIINSFEKLAYTLSKNEEERKALNEINNPKIREEVIMTLVKTHLKTSSDWLLIYDHVNNFIELEKYFPCGPNAWGRGKVIVTSRNSTIANNNFLNHSINVGELNKKEKLELFLKNINEKSPTLSSSSQEKIEKFLEKVPPFPLDISIAAQYIKITDTSFSEYLNNIQENAEEFSNTIENILKDSVAYSESRYKIVTLSLRKIIDTNPTSIELLVFISLLNPQHIPKDLLNKYKNSFVVNEVIHNLKKYSLVLYKSDTPFLNTSEFSFCHSTQEVALPYLTKELN